MIPRLAATELERALTQFPVVVLTGARQVGKTTLARALFPAAAYVTLDHPAQAERARLSPEEFLGALSRPAILDEIQYAPSLLRMLKLAVDRDRRPGQFLVTGSQALSLMAGASESLAGRAAVFTLPPLSLSEAFPQASIADTDRFLWRSGYPELWARPELDRDLWLAGYVATYLERDVRQVLQVGDLRDFDRFLRAAALRAAQLLSYSDLARDVGIAPNTAKRWLSVLAATEQVFLLEPYHRQRRKRLIKAPKLYFTDTGLLAFLQGFRSPEDLPAHALWRAVWENLVVAEVRKRLLARGRPPPIWFWRTAHGDEVDLLVETAPQRFVAIEAKAAERVPASALAGIQRLGAEYGPRSIVAARIACRSEVAYPLDAPGDARATPLGGQSGLLAEIARLA
jgi:predicted AAA+ superfamily ATPase